jgi:hypothetical protein
MKAQHQEGQAEGRKLWRECSCLQLPLLSIKERVTAPNVRSNERCKGKLWPANERGSRVTALDGRTGRVV